MRLKPPSHPAKIIMLRSQMQECHNDYMKRPRNEEYGLEKMATRAVD
jgi:uncharacterized protein (DUF39 family)